MVESHRPIDLWLSALVHGDETGGLAVINQVLGNLLSGDIRIDGFALGISIGNVEAARQGRRFIERDLNRSFSCPGIDALEVRRAAQLSPMTKRAKFTIDLHQTVEPSLTPFWVFPDQFQNFCFLQDLNQVLGGKNPSQNPLPLVSFPLEGFSVDGRTLLEEVFVSARTRGSSNQPVAVGIELGQKGCASPQVQFGCSLVRAAIELVREYQLKGLKSFDSGKLDDSACVYQIDRPIMSGNGAALVPGLQNFMDVHEGQVIARSSSGDILCPLDAKILFPKYGELALVSPELADLAVPRKISDVLGKV